MTSNYSKHLYKDYEELLEKNEDLEDSLKKLQDKLKKIEALWAKEVELVEKYEKKIDEQSKEIEALKKEILRLNGILGLDSNNSSIPTSMTPISKKKRVPNSRTHSGKKAGGQPGHAKSKLKAFNDDEITEDEEHIPDKCPVCGGELEKLEEDEVTKDETDYEVVLVRRRHHYPKCKCKNCGKIVRSKIPSYLKEENQYGAGVKALSLLLMNTGNTSVSKARRMIYGLSEKYINPSEGYIIKLQKTAAKSLEPFLEELHKKIIGLKLLYWDDTVISIHTERACLRYYGDEKYALYKAHMKKDKEGLDEDNILSLLSKDTVVMHDHNKINYNAEYQFSNIECNAHLLRDLEFIAENLPEHTWSKELLARISEANRAREEMIANQETSFSEEYVRGFFDMFNKTMITAAQENIDEGVNYYTNKERQLIQRLLDYKDNYFAWIVNFEYPFTNNLSERSLRGVKSKMKVSGQFQSEGYAQNYAAIKSYIETCYRNGVNEYEALRALCDGYPLTLSDIVPRTEK